MEVIYRTVAEALQLSKTNQLAKLLWRYEHNDKEIDVNDGEYKSWCNSLPKLLEVLSASGLDDNEIFFEYPAISTGGRIDAVLIGKNHLGASILLTIELKQWERIGDPNEQGITSVTDVAVPIANNVYDIRRHPLQQVRMYKDDLERNNSAVKTATNVIIEPLVFLHNCDSPEQLISGFYQPWSKQSNLGKRLFGRKNKSELINRLKSMIIGPDHDFTLAFSQAEYMLTLADLSGLKAALEGKENADMIQDQEKVDLFIQKQIRIMKKLRQTGEKIPKQLIIISGQPGTGKTIVGLHFLYDYVRIFQKELDFTQMNSRSENLFDKVNAVFVLPRSKTVHEVIDNRVNISVPYLNTNLPRKTDLIIIDEAHRIQNVNEDLDVAFSRTNLVIVLQDDYQRVLPSEQGTVASFIKYARSRRIKYHYEELTVQKRSGLQGNLVQALDKLFYDNSDLSLDNSLDVCVYSDPYELEKMLKDDAMKYPQHRNKLVAPFDWEWKRTDADIVIEVKGKPNFVKAWNPMAGKQAEWYEAKGLASIKSGAIDRVGCIYTVQGLEFDVVGCIWGLDFRWNEVKQDWLVYPSYIKDKRLKRLIEDKQISELDKKIVMKNIYRVLLTRSTKKLGIYFQDEATKKHVCQYLLKERNN